jgi:predicted DNA-binding mobile mystery protein A
MRKKSLQIQQIGSKLLTYRDLDRVAVPPTGWINAIRTALGMSLQQLGEKLSITKQSVRAIEKREQVGSVTINALRAAARAMDMQFVYGFVPNDGSLEALIDRKARELAKQIVLRTSNSMKLEDQENSKQRIEKAIEERALALKNEMPKSLWD